MKNFKWKMENEIQKIAAPIVYLLASLTPSPFHPFTPSLLCGYLIKVAG
jgi:hypothetical protein